MKGDPIQECRKLKNIENMAQRQETCSYCKEDSHTVENRQ